MPGVRRIYVYRFTPPGERLTLATAILLAGQHVMKHNKHVEKVDTVADGEDMLLRMTVHGHDQWWIKKNIIYPVVGIFTKVGIKVKDVKLDQVLKPEYNQDWLNDADRMIDHDEEIKVRKRQDEPWYAKHERARHVRTQAQ